MLEKACQLPEIQAIHYISLNDILANYSDLSKIDENSE